MPDIELGGVIAVTATRVVAGSRVPTNHLYSDDLDHLCHGEASRWTSVA